MQIRSACGSWKYVAHVIAVLRARRLVVQPVDGVDVRVVFTVQLLSLAAVHPHIPEREHLRCTSSDHRPEGSN